MTTFNEKYDVIGKVGEGSFAVVLKCVDKITGEYYAAKRLKKTFTQIDDVTCTAEVIATQILTQHPNILYMLEYYYSPTSGSLVFIFDLMDMSMYEYLSKRKRCMPETRVKNYLYQILKGLEHLHINGLFHRDVKPENILMKTVRNCHYHIIKLADFGSIRGIYSEHPYTDYISTRWYRSPECLLTTGYYGPKMDIWATGCVFYEMLTGKPLFPGLNEIDQLSKIHEVLGTPNKRLLYKLKQKSQNYNYFPPTKGTGLNLKLSYVSEEAIKLLKLTLEYDPDKRINVRRLLDQKYFELFRENDIHLKIKAPYVECVIREVYKNRGDFQTRNFCSIKKSKPSNFASKSSSYWQSYNYRTSGTNTTLDSNARDKSGKSPNISTMNCNILSKATIDKIYNILNHNASKRSLKLEPSYFTSKTTSSLLQSLYSKLL